MVVFILTTHTVIGTLTHSLIWTYTYSYSSAHADTLILPLKHLLRFIFLFTLSHRLIRISTLVISERNVKSFSSFYEKKKIFLIYVGHTQNFAMRKKKEFQLVRCLWSLCKYSLIAPAAIARPKESIGKFVEEIIILKDTIRMAAKHCCMFFRPCLPIKNIIANAAIAFMKTGMEPGNKNCKYYVQALLNVFIPVRKWRFSLWKLKKMFQ